MAAGSLEWAQDPDEVLALQQARAVEALADLLKQPRDLARGLRRAARSRRTAAESAATLQDVPF